MDKPKGIIIFGANGAGKTTLGREFARLLGYKHMDIEDYCFAESDIPYANPRTKEEYTRLMLEDIKIHGNFVITTCIGNLGAQIERLYDLAIWLDAPRGLRIERVQARAAALHGARVLKGGDMHEQTCKFMDFAANRDLEKIEQWAHTLACPMIRVDGTKDWRVNAAELASAIL